MVDDQVDGNQRIDLLGVSSQCIHGVPHGRKVHDGRYPCKVLKNDPSRLERHLQFGWLGGVPFGEILDILFGDLISIAVAQNRFQEHSDGEWKLGNRGNTEIF